MPRHVSAWPLALLLAACATQNSAAETPASAPPVRTVESHEPGPAPPPIAAEASAESSQQDEVVRRSTMTEADVKDAIVKAAAKAHVGPCRCPDDLMSNGRRCGGNSAYERNRGDAPVCSANDVTPDMIDKYRRAAAPYETSAAP